MLTKLALSPLLAIQALQVRARALALPEPAGARLGQAGEGKTLDLLILGDSSAAGVGATAQSLALSGQLAARLSHTRRLTWQLEARTGATSASSLAHLARLPPRRFDAALVVLGVNDVTRLASPNRWIALQNQLHKMLQEQFRVQHVFRSGLPPMGQFPLLPQPLRRVLGQDAARLDLALASLCACDPALTHIPLDLPFAPEYIAHDGFHPSEAAYGKWADLLAPIILQTTR